MARPVAHRRYEVRWSINFFLFRGAELDRIRTPDDEQEIAVDIPKRRGWHCGAVGSAIVAHYRWAKGLCRLLLPTGPPPVGKACAGADQHSKVSYSWLTRLSSTGGGCFRVA